MIVLGLVVALFANARTALEETNVNYTQSAVYIVAQSIPYYPSTVPKWTYCSCVNFAKHYLGKETESWGNANKIQPNRDYPVLGGLVLTYSTWGHIAVITSIEKDGFWVIEGNYEPCKQTERFIKNNSPMIRGFRVL